MTNQHPSRRELSLLLATVPVLHALLPGTLAAASPAVRAPHEAYATGLKLIHQTLRRNIRTIAFFAREQPDMKVEPFARFVATYVRFLGLHHTGEDVFIFPALRHHSAGRSSDVAFIDAREAEHRAVHATIEHLEASAQRYRGGNLRELDAMATISNDLAEHLEPHLAVEEDGLSAEHLAEMIPAEALASADHAMQKRDEDDGGADVLMLLVHSLAPDEQRQLLGGLPWFVRRVLMKRIWSSGWEPLLPFCYEERVVI